MLGATLLAGLLTIVFSTLVINLVIPAPLYGILLLLSGIANAYGWSFLYFLPFMMLAGGLLAWQRAVRAKASVLG